MGASLLGAGGLGCLYRAGPGLAVYRELGGG